MKRKEKNLTFKLIPKDQRKILIAMKKEIIENFKEACIQASLKEKGIEISLE